ncbi:hypothetical protein D3C75_1288520 [compost metagenome]
MHLRMFLGNQRGELFGVNPFELDHLGTNFFAIDTVEQAAGNITAQGFAEHAGQIAA